MAVGNFIIFLLMALAAVTLIFAETEPGSTESGDQKDAQAQGDVEEEPNERFFFRKQYTTCNYTATPGATCTSCTTALRCLSNNVGYVSVCRGFLPYCNAGRCSFFVSSICTSSG